jgi:hypothetical protein
LQTTCNGNGNGYIDALGVWGVDDWVAAERYRFWQHLSNAGLIKGNFSGRRGPNFDVHRIPGVNIPETPRTSHGLEPSHKPVNTNPAHDFSSILAQDFHVFGVVSSGSVAMMTPEEMFSMDQKIDDGKPAFGIVYSLKKTST